MKEPKCLTKEKVAEAVLDRPKDEPPRTAEQIAHLLCSNLHTKFCPCGCGAATIFFPDRSVLRFFGETIEVYHDLKTIGLEMTKVSLEELSEMVERIHPTHQPPERKQ